MELFVARQPIFDGQQRVFACEPLFRAGMVNSFDVDTAAPYPLVPYADYIKADLRAAGAAQQSAILDRYRGRVRFLAEKVETLEEFERAKSVGFAYFQGYFFSKPVIAPVRRIPGFKLNYLQILREIHAPEMSAARLSALVSREPSLSYKLPRFVNSALFTHLNEIERDCGSWSRHMKPPTGRRLSPARPPSACRRRPCRRCTCRPSHGPTKPSRRRSGPVPGIIRASGTMPQHHGVVIIGGGHNGLVAAAYLARVVESLLLVTPPPFPARGLGDAIEYFKLAARVRRLAGRDLSGLVKIFTQSASDFLDEWFESEELKVTLATDGVIGANGGHRSPGTAYILMHHCMGGVAGKRGLWGFVRGGMGAVSESIAASARHSGATIRTGAPVARIVVRGGQSYGRGA
ncbi:MAG TPA: HDOD domain-containing protein [Bryobacteraceae bacterium]|nr:HDOD domain-containing protein [Bryobacteraceae bacterium]